MAEQSATDPSVAGSGVPGDPGGAATTPPGGPGDGARTAALPGDHGGQSFTAAGVAVSPVGVPGRRLAGPGTTAAGGSGTGRRYSRDLADFPVPNGREEDWRFTPLRPLQALLAGDQPADGDGADVSWTAEGATVAFVDRDVPAQPDIISPWDRLAAVALAQAAQTLLVDVPAAAEGAHVHVTTKGRGGLGYARVAVRVGPTASATVILDHVGTQSLAGIVELSVGDGASLTLVTLQDWQDDAVHAAAHVARLGRDARLKHAVVTLGGALVRVTTEVDFAGPGGDANLLGLCFADAGQHLEHRLFVDHRVPNCRSRVAYKGALQGEDAHTVWVGDVMIRHAAVGTDTYELNRNLVLTDGARADSIPNLEIETGEVVGAGHASATGRFDDEQLFYLQARGIPEDEARRLVVRGFFAELIDQIGVREVTTRLVTAVDAELSRGGG